jgi:hypothetical protein
LHSCTSPTAGQPPTHIMRLECPVLRSSSTLHFQRGLWRYIWWKEGIYDCSPSLIITNVGLWCHEKRLLMPWWAVAQNAKKKGQERKRVGRCVLNAWMNRISPINGLNESSPFGKPDSKPSWSYYASSR